MQVHSNSKTNPFLRERIRKSSQSCRLLARELGLSVSTVHRWKKRGEVGDRSSRPRRLRQSMGPDCTAVALALRKRCFSLDECLATLKQEFPHVTRASLHRLYARSGVGRLRSDARRPFKHFKCYKPGFIHVDTFRVPLLQGKKRYCFISIDRATRLCFLRVYDRKSKASARDFLERLFEFFPFNIHRLLTDNGCEYTNRHYKGGIAKEKHPFEAFLEQRGVIRKLTKFRTPQTNGMAERMVRMSKSELRRTRHRSHEELEQHLIAWSWSFNSFRPHGSLGRRTPLEEARKWYKQEPELFTRNPDTILKAFTTC
jgi:transposase InsO family protein